MVRAKGKRVKSATKVQETLKKVPAHCASCPILNPENMRPSWRFGRVYGPDGGIYGFPDDEKTRANACQACKQARMGNCELVAKIELREAPQLRATSELRAAPESIVRINL